MWWWNDYYWPMHWVFGPLMMFFFVVLCIGMMWFMMRGRHGSGRNYALDIQRALCAWRDDAGRIRGAPTST